MSDETFERFRRKLADVVTVAINSGKRVSQECYCPLGCHPDSTTSIPFSAHGGELFGISKDDAFSFIRGFTRKEDRDPCYPDADRGPYFDLGCLYRSRFQ